MLDGVADRGAATGPRPTEGGEMNPMRTHLAMVATVLALAALLTSVAQAQDCRSYEDYLCWKGAIEFPDDASGLRGDISGTNYQYAVVVDNAGFYLVSTPSDFLDATIYGPVLPFGQFTAVIKNGNKNWVADSDSGLIVIDASNWNDLHIDHIVNVPAYDIATNRQLVICAGKDGGLSTVTEDFNNPQHQHTIAMPGDAWGVAVDGGLQYAYVACYDAGLSVVDVTTAPPSIVTTIPMPNNAVTVAVADTFLFLGTTNQYGSYGSLEVLSISDPADPQHLGGVVGPTPWGMAYTDGHLYTTNSPLRIYSLADPANPALVEEVRLSGQAMGGLTVLGDYCHIVTGTSWLSNPAVNLLSKPTHSFMNAHSTWDVGYDLTSITARGDYAYVVGFYDPGYLGVVDLTDGSVVDEEWNGIDTYNSTLWGDYLIVTAEYDGLVIYELVAPDDIELVTEFDLPSSDYIYEVDTYEHYAYVTAAGESVHVVDLSTPASPVTVNTLSDPWIYGSLNSLNVFDGVLYIGFEDDDGYLSIRAYDLEADPVAPPVLGELATVEGSYPEEIKAVGGTVYVCGPHGLTIADFSDPASPVWLSQLKAAGPTYCLDVSGTWVYLGSDADGLYVIDAYDPTAPEIVGHISGAAPAGEDPTDVLIHGDQVYYVDWDDYLSVGYRECGEILDVPEDEVVSGKRPGLMQNQPNPFNPKTSVTYTLPADGHAKLGVYNVAGRLVATLFDGPRTAGEHVAVWDGRTDDGEEAASGVYFCRLETEESHRSISMVLLK